MAKTTAKAKQGEGKGKNKGKISEHVKEETDDEARHKMVRVKPYPYSIYIQPCVLVSNGEVLTPTNKRPLVMTPKSDKRQNLGQSDMDQDH